MKYSTVKPGDKLKADAGFVCDEVDGGVFYEHESGDFHRCIAPDAILEVKEDEDGSLYVDCHLGQHCLDGEEDDELVGFTPA